jgi:hypothetical protein
MPVRAKHAKKEHAAIHRLANAAVPVEKKSFTGGAREVMAPEDTASLRMLKKSV